jgi:hypothetical protein
MQNLPNRKIYKGVVTLELHHDKRNEIPSTSIFSFCIYNWAS